MDKGNFNSEAICGESCFTALCLALGSLGGGPWWKAQGTGGTKPSSKSAGDDLLTPCPVMTIESGREDPEAGRDVNSWLSLWGVYGLLGVLSWFPNQKPRDRWLLTVKTHNGDPSDASLDEEWVKMGVIEADLLPVI